jgi:hypothetical protein
MAKKSRTQLMKEAITEKIAELEKEGVEYVCDISNAKNPKSDIYIIKRVAYEEEKRFWLTVTGLYELLVLNVNPFE